jgi:hypothetical protein
LPDYMLTTVDNPFDPFTQFDEWYTFDERHGYHSTGLLARVIDTSDELSEADQSAAIRDAIDEVVRENVLGLYRKVADDGSTTMETVDVPTTLNP